MPILNQMQELFRNTFTSNIHGIPTDCPAREKCGWTGDANIIADTSMVMWDAQLFWDKYIDDIVTAHREHGSFITMSYRENAAALIRFPHGVLQFLRFPGIATRHTAAVLVP